MKMTMVNSGLKGLTPWGRRDESAKWYDTAIQTQNLKFGLMSNTLPHGHGTEPQERIFAILRWRKVFVSLKPEYRERENLLNSGTTSDIVFGGTTKTIKICISLYLYVAFCCDFMRTKFCCQLRVKIGSQAWCRIDILKTDFRYEMIGRDGLNFQPLEVVSRYRDYNFKWAKIRISQ